MPLFSKKSPAKPTPIAAQKSDAKQQRAALNAKKKAKKQAQFQTMLDEEEEELKKRNANYAQVSAYQKAHEHDEKKAPAGVFVAAEHLNKIYSNRVQAVSDLSIDIKKGEFIVLVGPSGCGKSTTLRMLAGLEDITSGDLYIDGEYANNLAPIDRGVAMVFQSYALYPHMSVYENMAFGLEGLKTREFVRDAAGNQVLDKNGKSLIKRRSLTKQEIDERIQDAAKKLQITEYLQRKPTQLSGGQCQRVALGRAVVRHAKIFLLDEPLSNLDAKLRVQMRSELIRLHEELGNTMIYVTHDQTEAMTMANRIMVMNKGKVQQIGTPHEVYDSPANVFVATFMGSPTMNILPAHYDQGKISFPDEKQAILSKGQIQTTKAYFAERKRFLDQDIARLNHLNPEEKKTVLYSVDDLLSAERKELIEAEGFLATGVADFYFGIRPEDMAFSKSKETPLPVKVDVAELLGAEYSIHFQLSKKEVVARVSADELIKNGDMGYLSFVKEEVHLFDKVTQKRIF